MSTSFKFNDFLLSPNGNNIDFGSRTSPTNFYSKPLDNILTNNYLSKKPNPSSTYIDPFKELENQKKSSLNNYKDFCSGSSSPLTSLETRKMIEAEMAPYLSNMKNDLNLLFENFKKEIESKNEQINDLLLMKVQLDSRIVQNESSITKNSENILKFNDSQKVLLNKINEMQNEINITKINCSNINQKTEELADKVNDFSHMNNLQNLNNNNNLMNNNNNNFNEKFYKEISNNIEKITQNKIDILNEQIRRFNKDNININSEMQKMKIGLDSHERNKETKDRQLQTIIENLDNNLNKIQNLNYETNTALNQIRSENIKKADLTNKIQSLSQKIELNNDNYSFMQNNISSLKNEIKDISEKCSQNAKNFQKFEDSQKYLDMNIKSIEQEISQQKTNLTKIKNSFSEMVQQNQTAIYSKFDEQVNICKKYIDSSTEKWDDKFLDYDKKINEINQNINSNPFFKLTQKQKLTKAQLDDQISINNEFLTFIEEQKKNNEMNRK